MVHISKGISKLGASIPSVNLPAVITCRPDAPCFKVCYARKGRFSLGHTRDLLTNNLEVWRTNPTEYRDAVIKAALPARFFRWHSSGDIVDASYLAMMVEVAIACPKTDFLCFTKKYELVDAYFEEHGELPENLHMVYSAWGNFKPKNPHGFPCSYVRLKKEECDIPCGRQCSGLCAECCTTKNSCWNLRRNSGECVVFNQH